MRTVWLRGLARMVPPELREEWLREWEGELAHAHAARAPRGRLVVAALEDAVRLLPERLEAGAGVQDVRHALRALRAQPGFALAASATLALGIGANTAIFSVVNGYVVRPLPLPEPDRLVMLSTTREDGSAGQTSAPNYVDWRDGSTTVERLSAAHVWQANLTGAGRPLRVTRSLVTPGFFAMLGVQPVLGGAFDAAEGAVGRDDVIVLSNELWNDAFGGDPGIVGRRVDVDGEARTIVGVLPAGFRVPPLTAQVWAPLAFDAETLTARGRSNLFVVGRLRSGVTRQDAQSEMDRIAAGLAARWPRTNEGRGIAVAELHRFALGSASAGLWTLFGAVGLVLLLACANVANLVLARGAARERELAVRVALGASRGRLLAQLMGESVLISLAGGALGLGIAIVALDPIRALVPAELSRVGDVTLDLRVLGFTMAVSLATGVLSGLAPALRLSAAARTGASPTSALLRVRGGTGAVRAGLTVAQFAIATLLLIGAGLLARSLAELTRVDVGVEVAGRTAFGVTFPAASHPTPAHIIGAVDGVLERLAAVPGVIDASALSHLPLSGARLTSSVELEGRPRVAGPDGPSAAIVVTAANMFDLLRIPLVNGRALDARDRAGADPVVVLNESAAAAFWPEGDALGRWIRYASDEEGEPLRRRVVGIVADVRYGGPAVRAVETVYEPYAQTTDVWRWFGRSMTFIVRTADGRVLPLRTAQDVVGAAAPDLPVIGLSTLEDHLARSIATPRFHGLLTGGFALLALVVAVIGLYGVLAFTVRRRTRELGVRLALGASRGRVLGGVLADALCLAGMGAAAGALAALALTRVLRALVWGVETTDPVTWGVVLITLLGAAVAAALVPAWRAAAVDPATSLRAE